LVHSCLYILHYLSTCLLRTFSPQLFKKSRHTRKKSFFTEKKKKDPKSRVCITERRKAERSGFICPVSVPVCCKPQIGKTMF
jgi:hypothetical protein